MSPQKPEGMKPSRPRAQKSYSQGFGGWAAQLVLLLVLSTLLAIQTKGCIDRYLLGETGVSVELVSSSLAPFPAFTLCHSYDGRRHLRRASLEGLGITGEQYLKLDLPRGFLQEKNLTLRELDSLLSLRLEDILDSVTIHTFTFGVYNIRLVTVACLVDNFYNVFNVPGRIFPNSSGAWHSNPMWGMGTCYTLTVPEYPRSKGIRSITFTAKSNASLFLHHPGQMLSLETNDLVGMRLGGRFLVDLGYRGEHLIPNDGDPGRGYFCSEEMDLGFDECVHRRAAGELCRRVGCGSPGLPKQEGCRDCRMEEFNRTELSRFRSLEVNLVRYQQLALCSAPCARIRTVKGFPTFAPRSWEPDRAQLRFYFPRQVSIQRMQWLYSPLSMLAEIGGYTGLLLGVSLYQMGVYLCGGDWWPKIKSGWSSLSRGKN